MSLAMQMGLQMTMRMEPPSHGSRRKRLWELESLCHCPIIGVCFDLEQIRRALGRHHHIPSTASDFDVHTTAVRECSHRCALAEALHKHLERRHALIIRQFRDADSSAALLERWRAALATGNVAGALWATFTHPDCDAALTRTVYGEIHMLQHQVGADHRTDHSTCRALEADCTRLRQALAAAEAELSDARHARTAEIERLKHALQEARAHAARLEGVCARAQGEIDQLRAASAQPDAHDTLVRRARDAQSQCVALRAQLSDSEHSRERAERRLKQVEALFDLVMARMERTQLAPLPTEADERLAGRHVLCVGGRTGASVFYRELVERLGARYSHHDGGMEESLSRLEASIAAADAVICQTGCISHNAYWRVKETCKRTGKVCVFVKTPSLSAFLSGLNSLPATAGPNPASLTSG